MRGARTLILSAAPLWIAAAVGGTAYIFRYESRPAPPAPVAGVWPGDSGLARNRDGFQLVMAVHPRCPCTRASVNELNKLMLAWHGRVRAIALVTKPFELPDLWSETDLTARLRQIPQLEVLHDFGGEKASAFGAVSSGQTLLYDGSGRLVFEGGLTAFRGHEGPSVGVAVLKQLVAGQRAAAGRSKVFGCSLTENFCPMRGTSSEGHDHGDSGRV
jgi:hypothetical protein